MSYVIDATLNLQPPTNLKIVAAQIQSGLGGLKAAVSLDIKPSSVNRVNSLNTAIAQLNTNLKTTVIDANSAAAAISKLSQAASGAKSATNSIKSVGSTASSTSKSLGHLSSSLEATAARFTSFIIVAQIFNRTSNAIQELTGETIKWQKEMVKIGQVGNDSKEVVKGIGDEATRLGISLGVSSLEILKVASTLRQANLSAAETKTALQAIARASLAPSFTSTENVVEGLIATMGQFKVRAEQFESVLGSIAAVSNKYAVESNDLVTAIRITGAAFSQAGGSLEELIGLFTSVRQATREAPETIATGLKTIFSRLQDSNTVEKLAELGIQLRDTKGDFVGAFEAFRRLSDGLSKFSPGSQQAFDILQQVGGTRQVGKLIPAINEYKKAVEAVEVARKGQNSLDISTIQSQERLDVKLTKVKESFFELFKVISENSGFKTLVDVTTELIKNLTTLAKVLEPIVTPLLLITGLKLAGTVSTVGGSVFKTLTGGGPLRRAQGGPIPGEGFEDSVPALLMPGEHVVDKKTVKAVGGHAFFDNLKKTARRYAAGGPVTRLGSMPSNLTNDQRGEFLRRMKEYEEQEKKQEAADKVIYDSVLNYESKIREDYKKLTFNPTRNRKNADLSPIEADVLENSTTSKIPLSSLDFNFNTLTPSPKLPIYGDVNRVKAPSEFTPDGISLSNTKNKNPKTIRHGFTSPPRTKAILESFKTEIVDFTKLTDEILQDVSTTVDKTTQKISSKKKKLSPKKAPSIFTESDFNDSSGIDLGIDTGPIETDQKESITSRVRAGFSNISSGVSSRFNKVRSAASSRADSVKSRVSNIADSVRGKVSNIVDTPKQIKDIRSQMGGLSSEIKGLISEFNSIDVNETYLGKSTTELDFKGGQEYKDEVNQAIEEKINAFNELSKTTIGKIVNYEKSIKERFSKKNLKSFISSARSKASGVVSSVRNKGINLKDNFVSGVSNTRNDITNKISGLRDSATNLFKKKPFSGPELDYDINAFNFDPSAAAQDYSAVADTFSKVTSPKRKKRPPAPTPIPAQVVEPKQSFFSKVSEKISPLVNKTIKNYDSIFNPEKIAAQVNARPTGESPVSVGAVQSLFTGVSAGLQKREKIISQVADLLTEEAKKLGQSPQVDKIYKAAREFVDSNNKVSSRGGAVTGANFSEDILKKAGLKNQRFNVDIASGDGKTRKGFVNATSREAAMEAAQLQFANNNVSVRKSSRFGSIFGRKRFEIENQLGATSPIGPASAFVGPKPPGGFVPQGGSDESTVQLGKSGFFSRFRKDKKADTTIADSVDSTSKAAGKVADNLDDITESAGKASGKLGILTKVLAVGLAASTVNARVFGTPDQKGLLGTKGSKTATGISGFITGGSAGGLAGATTGSALGLGAIGSAVGGIFGILIGGISGVITSLDGFNKALREAEVAEAGRKFNEGSEDFLSGKATKLTDAQTFQFRQYVAKAGASAEDNKSLGFVEKATQVPAWFVGQAATVRENQLKSRKEQNIRDLAPIAQAANDIFNKSLDNGIKNPKDFIKSQLGQGIIDARTNLELAQRDPKTDVRTEAQVRDSITKAIIKEIVEKNLLSEAQKKTVATINSVNYAFSAMIIGLEQFNTAMDRVSENTEKKFNESNFRLNAGIGAGGTQSLQLGVGTLGPQGQRLEALAGKNGALDKAELLLPSILEKSFKETAASPGSSILDAVTKNVGNAGLGKEVTEQVINAFRDKDQAKSLMSDFQSGAGGKVVGSILNNFDPVRSIYKQRQADLEQQGGRFVQGLQTVSEINQQIGSQQDTSAGLRLNSARERTRQNLLVNGNTSEFGVANLPQTNKISFSRLQRAFSLQGTKVREGVKDIDLASVSELNRPFQQQQERLTGLQGGRATSAAAIQARLQQNQIGLAAARNSVLQNQETNPARALQGAADVQKFQQEIANNVQALKNLQDTTQSLAGAQEKLARIEGQLEGDKRSRLSFAESFVNASPQERREMRKNSLFAQQAISQGNFAGFNDKQAQGAIAFLNQLGDTRLQTGVDKKGNAQFAAASDIKNQLLINSGLAGGNSNDPLLAQREQLNKTINAGNLEAENASKVLTGVLQDQNNKFISDLSSLFEQYFGRGDVNRAGAVAQSNAPGLKGLQEQAATRQENAPAVSMQAMTDFSNSAQQLAASLATANIPSEILVKTAGNVNINLNGVEFIGQFSKEIDTYVNSKIAEYFAAKGPVQDVGV